MVDFAKLMREESGSAPIEPSELFRSLLTDDRFSYLRDVQQDVLREWHSRRQARDNIIKMSTGAGKTVVGLLMLQSCLNEGVGPAVYLCPTVQLVSQVVTDARDLGISVTPLTGRGELPVEFDNCESILITTFQKLFNALSVFGVASGTRQPIKIGTLLVDDAHSCLRIAREQTTLSWPANSTVYKQLFGLFESALRHQSETKLEDIRSGRPGAILPVPYWTWQSCISDIARLLTQHQQDDEMKFSWALVKEELTTCHCLFTGQRVEISPHLVPIRSSPSFVNADRRLFLSATLADDSILPREFDVDIDAVKRTLRPKTRGDIGERMILVPDLIEPGLGDQLPELLRENLSKVNVVVLVPSALSAERWRTAGATVAQGDAVAPAVESLRTRQGQFVVLVNRYDGIDLPDKACRVLVVDGLPKGDSLYDQHQAAVRLDSELIATRVAQTVEQGFGRGVRSGKDRCVVLVVGRDLVRFVGFNRNLALFSAETRKQVELGREVSKLASAENKSSSERLLGLMRQCLKGDEGWRKFHAQQLAAAGKDPIDTTRLKLGTADRTALNAFYAGDFSTAVDKMREAVTLLEPTRRTDAGWYLQTAATFQNAADPGDAQQMQKRAHALNHNVMRPLSGARYKRLVAKSGPQAERVLRWLQEHSEANAVVVAIADLCSKLTFGVDSETFEAAWKELGTALGFRAQRPEQEFGFGPDGLWALPDNEFLLAEAKSEVLLDRDKIHQSETEQLSNSVNWFRTEYGDEPSLISVLIHPIRVLAKSAYPPEGALVLDHEGIGQLHDALSRFAAGLASRDPDYWSAVTIGRLLHDHSLSAAMFVGAHCRTFSRPKRK